MNKDSLATLFLTAVAAGIASAQPYVYPTQPPPPGYAPTPPPGYFYVLPPDAGPYASFDAGPTFYQDGALKTFGGPASGKVHYSVGASGDASVGFAFNKYFAAGIELGVNTTTIDSIPGYVLDDAQFYNVPFLVNLTFSYPIPHSFVTPYIGGGIGGSDSVFDPVSMADNAMNNTVFGTEDDVVFAWEVHAGLRFQLTPNMSFGIGYKYFGTGDPNFSYPPAPNFVVGFRGVETHSVLANFTWRF